MTGLQSGTPASGLAPQSYRNSTQNAELQETLEASTIQQNQSSALNSLPVITQLKVVGQPQPTVLSVTSTSQKPESVRSNQAVFYGLTIAIISLTLTVYFITKYKKINDRAVESSLEPN